MLCYTISFSTKLFLLISHHVMPVTFLVYLIHLDMMNLITSGEKIGQVMNEINLSSENNIVLNFFKIY